MAGVQPHYSDRVTLVINPLQLLQKDQKDEDARRLRACIYRMTRKSAYLPSALQIGYSSMSKPRNFGAGANGLLAVAKMDGKDVVIKKIRCNDPAARKKCFEVWKLSDGIFSLQTKTLDS